MHWYSNRCMLFWNGIAPPTTQVFAQVCMHPDAGPGLQLKSHVHSPLPPWNHVFIKNLHVMHLDSSNLFEFPYFLFLMHTTCYTGLDTLREKFRLGSWKSRSPGHVKHPKKDAPPASRTWPLVPDTSLQMHCSFFLKSEKKLKQAYVCLNFSARQ